jgi:hypothetical protein
MIEIILFAVFALLLNGCAGVPQTLDRATIYPRDMVIVADGVRYDGVAVLPRKESYALEIHAKGSLDLLTMTSCHREESREKAGKSGWFGDKKRVEMTYTPAKGLEDQAACPLQFGGYEISKGRHSWAFIDFQDNENKLPATLSCNGWKSSAQGVSVCQAREGLTQRIEFLGPTKVYTTQGCDVFPQKLGQAFTFPLVVGECIYLFKEVAGSRTHRLTTLGYQSVIVRQ